MTEALLDILDFHNLGRLTSGGIYIDLIFILKPNQKKPKTPQFRFSKQDFQARNGLLFVFWL